MLFVHCDRRAVLASGLNRRQQERDEDADDRNYDQQLDQRKPLRSSPLQAVHAIDPRSMQSSTRVQLVEPLARAATGQLCGECETYADTTAVA